jgi:hypothetical protein
MRVHIRTFANNAKLSTGAYKNHNLGMSTDWEKYSTPGQTQQRGRKAAPEYGVVAMFVAEVRLVPGQTVEHEPEPENRAHTEVVGEKDEEVRVLLRRCSTWVIPPSIESA